MDLKSLAAAVQGKRKAEGLTQRQAAQRIGVSQSLLNRLEAGSPEKPRPDNYLKLCRWIGVSPEQFLEALPRRTPQTTMEKIEAAIYDDPALGYSAANNLIDWMRRMYSGLVEQQAARKSRGAQFKPRSNESAMRG